MTFRSAVLIVLLAMGAAVVTPPSANAIDLACCCFNTCAEGPAACLYEYFISTCESAESQTCTVSPLSWTTDPTQVHPFWFLYQDGMFSGFSISCMDF